MIPIVLGKKGKQPSYVCNTRITIHPERRRIIFPPSLWAKFEKYPYIDLYTPDLESLCIRFSPVKNSSTSTTSVVVHKNGRVEFNISRRLAPHLNRGRYLYNIEEDFVIITNALKDSYADLLKLERSKNNHIS